MKYLISILLFFTCIFTRAYADSADLITKNQTLRDIVNDAIFTAKDIVKTPVITSASQMTSPYSQNDRSSTKDGGNLSDGVLIDGNADTYWHSVWSEGSVATGSHYIQISCSEPLSGDLCLYIRRRITDANHLTELTLKGSNSPSALASSWKTITVQQIGNASAGLEWTTPLFSIDNTSYSYLRIYATQSTFWHCSELQIYKMTEGPNAFFSQLGDVATNLQDIYNENLSTADENLTEELYTSLQIAYDAFIEKAKEAGYLADASSLIVNEIQVCNTDQFVDPSFNYGGWVELYNPTNSIIKLSGLYVSGESTNPTQFLIPSTTETIAPKSFHTLWFDHNAADGYYGGKAVNQVNFKLEAEGDTLFLFNHNGTLLLSQTYPAGIPRCSWARTTDFGNEWMMCSTPTPGKSNSGSSFSQQRLAAPVVDTDGTLFVQPFTVHVTIPQGTVLKYTTDGTTPTLSNGMTSADGTFSIQKTTVLRFCLFADGYLPSPVVTRSYIYRNHDYYLPVISVVTNPDNLYDDTIGVYTKGTNGRVGNGQSSACNWNMDWERPVNVEYMEPVSTDGSIDYLTRINQEADFEISGGWTRAYGGGTVDGKYWPMKSSFRIKTDKRYEGKNSLDYPVFPNKPYNKYKVWQVRNGGNDTHARIIDPSLGQMVIQSGFNVDAQDCQSAHVFFNGEYLGMLNIRESNNRHYGYSNFGIDTDDMDQFDLSDAKYNQKVGDKEAWNQLVALSQQLASDKSEQTYNQICHLLDMNEYVNYMALECYLGNSDWVTNVNNVKGYRSRSNEGKFRFVLFDCDSAFGNNNMTNSLLNGSYSEDVDDLFRNLMQYAPFREQFVTAFSIVNGSVLHPDSCTSIVHAFYNNINPALQFEGNSSNVNLANIITNVYNGTIINNMASTLKLSSPYNITLSSNISQAHLSLNGQEIPRARLSGNVYPPATITAKAPVGYTFQGWVREDGQTSAMIVGTPVDFSSEWTYYDQGSLDGKNWTAPFYNTSSWKTGQAPLGYANQDKYMYQNSNTILDYGPDSSNKRPTYYLRYRFYLDEVPDENTFFALNYRVDDGFRLYVNGEDIDGYQCAAGIKYADYASTFQGETPYEATVNISADKFHRGWNVMAVEVHNCSASSTDIFWDAQLVQYSYSELNPDMIVSTDETFNLSESLDAGTYNLKAVFKPITDYRTLLEKGANPIRINEISAANDIYINDLYKKKDWVELYNATASPVDLAGMYLSDNPLKPQKYQIQATEGINTVVPPYGHLIIWCDGSQPVNQLHAPFKLDNADGASILLQAQDGTWQDRLDYMAQDRWQTYGRYPDGGVFESILKLPTISKSNVIGTYDFTADNSSDWIDDAMAITIDLAKGWNWTSHNLSQPVDKSRFTSFAQGIYSMNDSVVVSQDAGWTGTLTQLTPAEGYKMNMQEAASISLRGQLYDVTVPVTLQEGWNWIGVPLYNATTLRASLQNYQASEGDVLMGLESFAVYEDGDWHGPLTSLSPGQSYLLKAGQAQEFNWNTLSTTRAGKRRYASAVNQEQTAWPLDIHAYPHVMSVIAVIKIGGTEVDATGYSLGAFVGDECRGVAQLTDGLLFMNIHGVDSETISFRLLMPDGTEEIANQQITFTLQSLQGTCQAPMVISIGQEDEVVPVIPTGKIMAVSYYNIQGQRIAGPTDGIYLQETIYQDGRVLRRKVLK